MAAGTGQKSPKRLKRGGEEPGGEIDDGNPSTILGRR